MKTLAFASAIFALAVAVAAPAVQAPAASAVRKETREERMAKLQARPAAQMTEAKVFEQNGQKLLYRWHAPKAPVPGKAYPLVILFHGAGERGADNISQLVHGADELLTYAQKTGEEIFFIAGQVPNGQQWVNTPWTQTAHTMPTEPSASMSLAMALIERTMRDFPVDASRVYVTGISMGGYGTWDIVQRRPALFAAAMPICGGGDVACAAKIKNVPIWCFHGDKDGAVPTNRSRDMFAAIKAAGGNVQYREYPGVGHNCWSRTYGDDAVLKWFFAQRRNPAGVESLASLQARIDAAGKAGGGKIVVAAGEHYLEGPIHLRSNIELHLEEGAKVVFADDPKFYLPSVLSTWEGVECKTLSPLVYAYGCTNVAITGKGTFAPKMDFWRTWFGRGKGHMDATRKLYDWCSFLAPVEERDVTKLPESNVRPHLMQFNRCRNVRLEGFRIRESPFWTIHLFLSQDCVVRGLDVFAHGHNNDGVDVEMSRNVLIENCVFDQGDDAIVIKSGRNQDAWRLASPSENIEVRNCKVVNGHTLLGIGSEMSGGVRNVYMHDCELASEAFRLFYVKVNERRGGFVENIRMENVKAKRVKYGVMDVETDVIYQWKDFPTHEIRITPIKGLSMKNVSVEEAKWLVHVKGDRRLPVHDVRLENVTCVKVAKPNVVENAENVVVVP